MSRTTFLFIVASLAMLILPARQLKGYALEGQKWPNGTIIMNLQLSSATYPYPQQPGRGPGGLSPAPGLQDFSPTWNDVAQTALNNWNQYLANVQFASTTDASVTPTLSDTVNSVFFDSKAFGSDFGSDALAVTIRFFNPATNVTTSADVVVNTNYRWDSFRGNLQFSSGAFTYDILRVLEHEFGHVLGLNHPDLANPQQEVVALMNSVVSDLDHIEVDDIDGAMFLYGQKAVLEPISVIASPANGGNVTGSGSFQLSSTHQLTATPSPGWYFVGWEDGSTNLNRSITVPLQGGTYTATFEQATDHWGGGFTTAISSVSNVLYAKGQFYAFGLDGTAISSDGLTWQTHLFSGARPNIANTFAYGNGIFVATTYTGVISTSTDGYNWTSRQGPASNLGNVAYGNGIFVAAGISTDPTPTPMLVSSDGITWTAYPSGVEGYGLTAITYGNGIFVAMGSNGDNYVSLVSNDGKNWVSAHLTDGYGGSAIGYGNGQFVASCNNGLTFKSSDGINWTQGDSLVPAAADVSDPITAITYGDGVFIALNSELFSTTDGSAWTQGKLYALNQAEIAFGQNIFVMETGGRLSYSGVLVPNGPQPVLPTITSDLFVSHPVGVPFTYQIVAANTPTAYNAIGLPDGLSISTKTGDITGTPTTTGTFTVPIFATNDAGSATTNLTISLVPVTQTFGQWLTSYSLAGTASDTPQHDGVPNLMKYLHDIDPSRPMTSTDRAALPALGITTTGANVGGVTLTYRQNALATGVTVNLQTSIDLRNWTTLSSTVSPSYSLQQVGTDTNNDPIMQIAIMPTGAPKQFYRLNVTSP